MSLESAKKAQILLERELDSLGLTVSYSDYMGRDGAGHHLFDIKCKSQV
jgi:hypothetical protein